MDNYQVVEDPDGSTLLTAMSDSTEFIEVSSNGS